MDYSEVDEDDEDLYEGLEADNLLQGSYEKRIEEKKKEVERVPVKPKEQFFEKSRRSLYKKLSGAKVVYTKKEPCLFLGAPQLSEGADEEDNKVEFLLLVNLLYFINDVVIKNYCEKIGKVKRVVILEDDKHGKSLGICLVEFYSLDSSQNYVAYLKEKLKADVRKVSLDIEEQIKGDEMYNYGGYINSHTIELIKRDNLDVLQCTENIHDALSKSLNLNKHPIFSWFNTSMKDVLSTYVKSELKKKKKNAIINNDYMDRKNESDSDSGSDISAHIIDYVSKKNKFLSYGKS
ncbi:conserved Plasmodium protein, unknown function [Plasmodium knowlesi strain H]|uniref:RRM domain-containing protein n=3 Tax=Plasmodium knowlesi TaxID=5850 RepID=A0A5K1VRM3_PLAKH|nr:conserved Plasmodium protein, unknown function [Plasmodium knowlesi strain H]OTN63905.1 Uncharacterized protein PKNOH_S140235800 [Plasmodium knowlesi]CAA9990780.1 conserved Plasmodium protein, unknown function [Plasmodium knowlesi strain H]SBO21090.1 conserved Plasmodium protein, unknown function [Plasmodium knowlesi strain H]SBO21568.1 conserved Plasmodium protein, unknown function [Plasmodium knowlesi strain H]VVS80254.1 conserved Plasmodium protein, unknown function [Plasmodium knowlesi |eukprot:XP_002262069.1 hypothetical protein, conserved in Plasmodium species [Plasmodium knowlesi strain H]